MQQKKSVFQQKTVTPGDSCIERDRLFDRYGKAVQSYQTVVLELQEAAPSGYRYFYSALLKTADAAQEHLRQCRDEYEAYCLLHDCQATHSSAAAAAA